MSTTCELEQLKELLASQLDRLVVLQKNKLWASAQVLERRIQSTKNAISQAEKAMKK
jgi:hypothetical protein